jgi:hypothetical protein
VLEQRAGNATLARELFKAALKVDPKNESTWSTWISMEEDLGRLEAANELRIRRSEQQWEFVIPSSFSTRVQGMAANVAAGMGMGPAAGSSSGSSSSSSSVDVSTAAGRDAGGSDSVEGKSGLLQTLLGTLNRFFSARGAGVWELERQQQQQQGAASSSSSSNSKSRQQQLMSELLPADFRADLTLEDIISEAATLDASGGSSSSSSELNGSANTAAAVAQWTTGGDVDGQAVATAGQAALAARDGGEQGSSSIERKSSSNDSDAGRSSSSSSRQQLFRRQRQQERAERQMGLQQKPVRPPPVSVREW